MKIKSNLILKQIAGSWVAITIGDESENMNGVLSLNDSGVLLWKLLEQGSEIDDLVRVLSETYTIEESQAAQDVTEFVDKLRKFNCLECC